jgi:hypothetical protein
VPDYLALTREMARVTGRGGVVYIDHEASPAFWEPKPEYARFLAESSSGEPEKPPFSRFFRLATYINKIRQLRDPRYISEGDIHVWPDDHVAWPEIEKLLAAAGCSIPLREDYLLFKRGCPPEVYRAYEKACDDMRVMAALKL